MKTAIRSSRSRGFTLVEVLATLLLLGIVVPVAMRGVSLATLASSHARRLSEASQLAESKLNELVVTGDWQYMTSGDFAPDHPDFHWTTQTSTGDYSLTSLSLQVTWQERGQNRQYVLTTLIRS